MRLPLVLFVAVLFPLTAFSLTNFDSLPPIARYVQDMDRRAGFFPVYWDEATGRILLEISEWEEDFLYVNSLAAGLGSNDIGLDRNQLGRNRVVRFERSGPRVLLIERNLDYRAVSDNAAERLAVQEAFAESVLFGAPALAATDNRRLIDLTPLLYQDEHGVIQRLKSRKQGTYKVDLKRSAIHLERTRNFPDNSEFEARLTFAGLATGSEVRSVSPTSGAISLRQHHSFVRLPDEGYEPRVYDPRCGYFSFSYADYAQPIDQPLRQRFVTRHRLQKVDPTAARSAPVEPIVYYLDRGTPEPIRSALLDGARWWNEAFESAGYIDAFRVEVLPEGADPLDVRYNLINWVHRSTRGWSYGSSVIDPRTGEIIKGHVLLGSLRVRQDFLLAQGIIEAYAEGESADPRLVEMALARLRQLSAHEVGHTLGLAHNFAASVDGRASVMDYPHPFIQLLANEAVDVNDAYDIGIGAWDKRTILYGYADFRGSEESTELERILAENEAMGLHYLSDQDARSLGSAHPLAHLWDNGTAATEELNRINRLRRHALDRLGAGHIAPGQPLAELERILVPVYLMHRYQVEAVAKQIGGYEYDYSVNNDDFANREPAIRPVSQEAQKTAAEALLYTLQPEFLGLSAELIQQLPPHPPGYSRDRELFNFYTGATFDPLAVAETSADLSLRVLLHPQRLARLEVQGIHFGERRSSSNAYLDFVTDYLVRQVSASQNDMAHAAIAQLVFYRYLQHLLSLAQDDSLQPLVRAGVLYTIEKIEQNPSNNQAFRSLISETIRRFREGLDDYEPIAAPRVPDGSPIGCGH